MNQAGRVPVWLQVGVVFLGLMFIILGGSLHDWLVDRFRFPVGSQFRGTVALSFALVLIGLMMSLTGWLKQIQQERFAKDGDALSTRAIVLCGVSLVLLVFVVEVFHGRPRTGMGLWAIVLYFGYWRKSRQNKANPVS